MVWKVKEGTTVVKNHAQLQTSTGHTCLCTCINKLLYCQIPLLSLHSLIMLVIFGDVVVFNHYLVKRLAIPVQIHTPYERQMNLQYTEG